MDETTIPKELGTNLRWRRKLLLLAEGNPRVQNILRDACRRSLVFFVCAFGWTRDPRKIKGAGPRRPFISYEYQDEAFAAMRKALGDGTDLLIDKSRDMGASWCILFFLVWCCLFIPDFSVLMISRKEELVDGQADSLFSHVRFILDNLPRWMLPRHHSRKLHIEFTDNRSVMEGEGTTENPGRGGRRSVMDLDEFSRMPNGGYAVDAATQDVTNTRLFNSTPFGIDNAYYKLKTSGNIPVVRMHWSRHPEKNRGLYRPGLNGPELLDSYRGIVHLGVEPDPDKPGALRPKAYKFPEDYPFSSETPRGREKVRSPWYDWQCRRRQSNKALIAQELDIDDAGAVQRYVDDDWLALYIADHCSPAKHRGNVLFKDLTLAQLAATGPQWTFQPHDEGALELWCPLDHKGQVPRDRPYIVSCDISEGTGSSNSVASIIDKHMKCKVGQFTSNRLMIEQFAEVVVNALCPMFAEHGGGLPLLIWEGNGPGRTFKRVVCDRHHYANVWYSQNDKHEDNRESQTPGWFSESDSRDALLRQYREALSGEPAFHNPSQTAMEEAGRYTYAGEKIVHPDAIRKRDGSVDIGRNHGDAVIADALGVLALGPISLPLPEEEPPTVAPNSMGWRAQQRGLGKKRR